MESAASGRSAGSLNQRRWASTDCKWPIANRRLQVQIAKGETANLERLQISPFISPVLPFLEPHLHGQTKDSRLEDLRRRTECRPVVHVLRLDVARVQQVEQIELARDLVLVDA